MRISAAVLAGTDRPVEVVDDVELADPGPGEALVEIVAAGVCGSDLGLVTGKVGFPMPVVLGHEAAGRVLALGPDTAGSGVEVGGTVALWMRPPCRRCRACLRGDAALCATSAAMSAKGVLADGGSRLARAGAPLYRAFGIGAFATHCVMPVAGLVPVPAGVPASVAALVSCGVATGAGAVLNVARPEVGDTVVVFGAGGVGLAAVMAAAAVGAGAVVVVDPAEHRREIAMRLGATAAVAPPATDRARAELAAAAGGAEIDVVVDAVGSPDVVALGYRAVRQGGTVVAVGLQPAGSLLTLPGPAVPIGQKRLLGCFMGAIDPQRDMPKLFALYRRGAFPVDRLVSARRGLDGVPRALDDLAAASGLRTVIEPVLPAGRP